MKNCRLIDAVRIKLNVIAIQSEREDKGLPIQSVNAVRTSSDDWKRQKYLSIQVGTVVDV